MRTKMNYRMTLVFSILVMIIVSNPNGLQAQGMPVYDNTNFLTLGKSLIESARQTSELLKTVEFLKQQKDRIEKVSAVVKQLRAVQDIAQNNRRLFDKVRGDVRVILNSPYIRPNEVSRISNSFDNIIKQSLDDIDFIDQILSSNFLKMTDGERTAILKKKEQESREMVAEIDQKTRIYQEILSFREMQDKINNREAIR